MHDYAAIFAERAERLKRLRENPQSLPAVKAYYRDNPVDFISDWGITFDPRMVEKNLPAVLPFILFEKQREWVDWILERWRNQENGLTEKSREMGVSWLSVALGTTLCLFHEGMVVGYGSRKEEYVDKIGSPKSLFWKARMFIEYLPEEFRPGFDIKKHCPHMRINFPNTGSAMSGESGDGIGRGDRTSIYFVDESAFLERPQLVEASLSQTTNCRQDVSTPNGTANPFAEKRLSGNVPVFTFHWRDDPRKDEAWYEKQKHDLDAVTLAQEVDINYSASVEGVLIPSAWIQSAIGAHEKLGFDPHGEKLTSLDVADLGKDSNAHTLRNGVMIQDIREWQGESVEDIYGTTNKAFENCDEWRVRFIRYDSDGLGAGVRGDARALNEHRNNSVEVEAFQGGSEVANKDKAFIEGRTNGEFFDNYKAQCWWMLRERFKATHEAIEYGKDFSPDDLVTISKNCQYLDRLSNELSQPTYKKSARGKVVINKAPDGAKSPNLADSVMMAFAVDKRHHMPAFKVKMN